MLNHFLDILRKWSPFTADPGFPEDLLEVLFEDDGSHYESKRIDGIVTKLIENEGVAVISHEIYMDLSIPIPGGKKLRLNDFVIAVVKRRCEDDAWRVERVEMIERSKKPQNAEALDNFGNSKNHDCKINHINGNSEHLLGRTMVGQVTNISNYVVVNNGEFELPLSNPNGIVYVKGDWLTMKVLFDPEEKEEKLTCIDAEPLRKWQFEGRVNVLLEENGVIDNDVFFHISACINGYLLNFCITFINIIISLHFQVYAYVKRFRPCDRN